MVQTQLASIEPYKALRAPQFSYLAHLYGKEAISQSAFLVASNGIGAIGPQQHHHCMCRLKTRSITYALPVLSGYRTECYVPGQILLYLSSVCITLYCCSPACIYLHETRCFNESNSAISLTALTYCFTFQPLRLLQLHFNTLGRAVK